MRLLGYCLGLFCLTWTFLLAGSTCRGAEEPQRVVIRASGLHLRCGPGLHYYATDSIPAGTELEVYRETGGWLAVRPLESSFSWVEADAVELGEELSQQATLGTITREDTVSWCGTHIGRVGDHLWQVQLDEGEQVAILGQREIALHSSQSPRAYYQIKPPAGEFRWIHESDVVRPALWAEGTDKSKRHPAAQWTAASGPKVPDILTSQTLRDLEVKLTRMVARNVSDWDIAPLRNSLEQMAVKLASPEQRSHYDSLKRRLESFASLAQRYQDTTAQLDQLSPQVRSSFIGEAVQASAVEPALLEPDLLTPQQQEVGSGLTPAGPRSAPSASAGKSLVFAGEGWLMPVYSTKKIAPPYALIDKDGTILNFVSPSPGMDLTQYVKRRVGIVGDSRRLPDYPQIHLMAERVIVTGKARR